MDSDMALTELQEHELPEAVVEEDEDDVEELRNSLREVVQDQSVKPKLQCLMVDPSFSMVTVQSEDSGIVWETASSRCSTPWASEASYSSDTYSLDGSATGGGGAQGKITIVFDEDKIVRRRKRTRGKARLGERLRRPGSSRSGSALGVERPEMAEVSVPNIRVESVESDTESGEVKDKEQELFSLISEGYEILNIKVPSKLPTVDEEESTELQDNLSYLEETPRIRSKSRRGSEALPAQDYPEMKEVQEGTEGVGESKPSEPTEQQGPHSHKDGTSNMDYFEAFTLLDEVVPGQQVPEPVGDEAPVKPQREEPNLGQMTATDSLSAAPDDDFVFVTDMEIASERLDEVFYGNKHHAPPEDLMKRGEEEEEGGKEGRRESLRSLKESGSALFGREESILTPIFLSPGPPKIIDPILLEEPTAMSFLYSDLYEDAMGERRRSDEEGSEAESVGSDRSFQRRLSDSEETDGYLEKFILKDETPNVEDQSEEVDGKGEGLMMWSQSKFELTGFLTRVVEEEEEEEKEECKEEIKAAEMNGYLQPARYKEMEQSTEMEESTEKSLLHIKETGPDKDSESVNTDRKVSQVEKDHLVTGKKPEKVDVVEEAKSETTPEAHESEVDSQEEVVSDKVSHETELLAQAEEVKKLDEVEVSRVAKPVVIQEPVVVQVNQVTTESKTETVVKASEPVRAEDAIKDPTEAIAGAQELHRVFHKAVTDLSVDIVKVSDDTKMASEIAAEAINRMEMLAEANKVEKVENRSEEPVSVAEESFKHNPEPEVVPTAPPAEAAARWSSPLAPAEGDKGQEEEPMKKQDLEGEDEWVFTPLRSFAPQEDLSELHRETVVSEIELHTDAGFTERVLHRETAEELEYEIISQQEAREMMVSETERKQLCPGPNSNLERERELEKEKEKEMELERERKKQRLKEEERQERGRQEREEKERQEKEKQMGLERERERLRLKKAKERQETEDKEKKEKERQERERHIQLERERDRERQRLKEEKERQEREKQEKERRVEKEREKEKQRLKEEKEEKERYERKRQMEREREKERQRLKEEKERQARERTIELERERERETQRLKEEKERQERERQMEKEREKDRQRLKEEKERQEKEKERQERERQLEKEREKDRQRLKEEKERQEKERQERQRQIELERERENERQRLKEREEKERQETERQMELEREREREMHRLKEESEERERQVEREREKERQRLKEEKERQARERTIELERERERERQRLKERQERERQMEKEREKDRQRLKEEKERQEKEKERQERERQIELERERENERQRLKDREEKERQERERQMELEREREKERQRLKEEKERQARERTIELERERERETQRLKEEKERQERERQMELEREREREMHRLKEESEERERQVEREREKERQRLKEESEEKERQERERERERQRLKEEKDRQEKERQEREKQMELEREREKERQRLKEREEKETKERERQMELEMHRLKEESEEKEKQERERERDRQRLKEEEKRQEKERQERERQMELEREREKERQRLKEREEKETKERERQMELERERENEMQRQKEREERERERERQRLKEESEEKERQERERQMEKEREKDRQRLKEEKERQEKERHERERQMELERERERERQRLKEESEEEERERERENERQERERQIELEREREKERQRLKEREEKERQETERQMEREREKDRQRVKEEKERQERMEKERQERMEKERQVREEKERQEREGERQRLKEVNERQEWEEKERQEKKREMQEEKERHERESQKEEKERRERQKEKERHERERQMELEREIERKRLKEVKEKEREEKEREERERERERQRLKEVKKTQERERQERGEKERQEREDKEKQMECLREEERQEREQKERQEREGKEIQERERENNNQRLKEKERQERKSEMELVLEGEKQKERVRENLLMDMERQKEREMEERVREERGLDLPAYEEPIEADYEIFDAEEESQARAAAALQGMDCFCLGCGCLLSETDRLSGGHQDHEVTSVETAYEDIRERLSEWISELQERSENIEDLVSELELGYNTVEDHCRDSEEVMEAQNEEMMALVMEQYNTMSLSMEEEKKAKLEQLYDQIVSFQESIDQAKVTLDTTAREAEIDPDTQTSKDIYMRLTEALQSAMSLELGPRGLLVFEDYAKGNAVNTHTRRKGIPVPQKPSLQPQECASASSTSVTVYWRVNPGDIIDCFQVYCMEDPQGAVSDEYRVTVKESYCVLEELEPDKVYKVWVMAVNYTGCSLPSERLPFRTAPSVPVIDTGRCTILWDSATLRWNVDNQTPTQSYTLEYCRQYALEGEGLRSISGIQGRQQRVLLHPNENYLFYIKAVNKAGASEQSEAALISTRGTRFHLLKASAHPVLKLSEDQTTLYYPQDTYTERGDVVNECPSVLGELLPMRGHHYWETNVTRSPAYRVGVAYETANRDSLLGENSTSWCLHCVPTPYSCRFELLHGSVQSDVFVGEVPSHIGTLLDYKHGRLSFYDTQRGQLLGTLAHCFTQPCHPVLGMEQPGSLKVSMALEVADFAKHS